MNANRIMDSLSYEFNSVLMGIIPSTWDGVRITIRLWDLVDYLIVDITDRLEVFIYFEEFQSTKWELLSHLVENVNVDNILANIYRQAYRLAIRKIASLKTRLDSLEEGGER